MNRFIGAVLLAFVAWEFARQTGMPVYDTWRPDQLGMFAGVFAGVMFLTTPPAAKD
jgi:hypothetical protein